MDQLLCSELLSLISQMESDGIQLGPGCERHPDPPSPQEEEAPSAADYLGRARQMHVSGDFSSSRGCSPKAPKPPRVKRGPLRLTLRCTDFFGDSGEAAPRMQIMPLDLESTNPAENVMSFMEQVLGIERTSEATLDLDDSIPVVLSETPSDGVNSEAGDDIMEGTTLHTLLFVAVAKALADGGVTTSGFETPVKKKISEAS